MKKISDIDYRSIYLNQMVKGRIKLKDFIYHEPEIENILGVPTTDVATLIEWPMVIRAVR
ncbi:hypothetical protein GC105_01590 [Alkalibaculum sp. M08DMB]|uniref:Uncharacterized protein n=1 Tax=Alkalibaculum sporogenes TaxID=2655001 RepID=A0A6A7K4U7_9FIRM|nr:hypothetical protein [Alkalibaculum sporogenes]MPW24486.1 hypothetical protein [Alkalibaculum sporogenes]